MDGKVLAKWKVSTAGIRDPQVVVRLIHEGVEDLLQKGFYRAACCARLRQARPASRMWTRAS
jgi:hypothetical protein